MLISLAVILALPALYMHQVSEAVGQCRQWYILSLIEAT